MTSTQKALIEAIKRELDHVRIDERTSDATVRQIARRLLDVMIDTGYVRVIE